MLCAVLLPANPASPQLNFLPLPSPWVHLSQEERGESFYNPLIPDRLAELKQKGISQLSDGAECVFTEGSPNPLIVRKTDGGFNYASTDLAAIWQRVTQERADWIVYVTDIGQAGHFQQVFVAAKSAGWVPADGSVRVDHVGFGLVLGEDGKRFRTRSSEVVRLADLLDEAKARCLAQLKERGGREGDSEADLEAAAEAMGAREAPPPPYCMYACAPQLQSRRACASCVACFMCSTRALRRRFLFVVVQGTGR